MFKKPPILFKTFVLILAIGLLRLNVLTAKETKTALVLSGGGARGFAHVGVIKALEEIGFYPDMVIGTSMGALVGALYASGNTSQQIESYIRNTKWKSLFSPQSYRDIEFVSQKITDLPELFALKFDENFNIIFPTNLLPAQQLQERIFQITVYPDYLSQGNFDSLAIPFRAVATDLKTGKEVIIKKGNLARTIAASSSFPIILAPVALDTFLLVDGGLTNNVPCDVAVAMGATFIVAVDVTSKITSIPHKVDLVSYFNQALNTLSYPTDTRNLYLANVLIHPDIEEYSSTDFYALDSLVDRGYRATLKYADELRLHADSSSWKPDYLPNAVNKLNQTTIDSIRYSGNQVTRPYIIRRELLLKPGELWNSAYARRSLKNLFSTGLFQSVYLSLEEKSENSAILNVEVEEDERAIFTFGARYDSEKKASAFIAAKYRNLFGAGIDNQISLIASDQLRKFEIDSRTTRILNTTFTGFTSLYNKYENIPLYSDAKRVGFGEFYRSGFEINAGVQIRRVGLSAVGFKLLRTEIPDSLSIGNFMVKEDAYNTGSFLLRILVENTDDPDIPRQGRKNNILYEHSISQDNLKQYDRISCESIVYETYGGQHTFSTIINFGYLTSALSYYERFRLGGVSTLPGYRQDEFWGNLMLALGIGYRTPLTTGSYLCFQAMAGNVWNDFTDFNWQQMRIGVRAGILIPTPLGPIAIDYGINFKNYGLFYLSVGHYF
jgi:NTE family protein